MSDQLEILINDNLSRDGIYVIVFCGLAIYGVQHIAHILHVKKNWDRMRCRPEVMGSAWMYGKDDNDNMEYCLENAGKQIVNNDFVSPIQKRVEDINAKFQQKIRKTDASYNAIDERVNNADLYKNKQNTNLAIAIQNNILAVKEGMQKIIASLIIQKHMTNGIMKMTNSNKMFNDSLRDGMNKTK
jgi:hypothetical protein